jgi:hypothetical protein
MTDAPRMSAWIDCTFDGPIATDFGSIWFPEGHLAMSRGEIAIDGDRKVEGLAGELSIRGAGIEGALCFEDNQENADPLLTLGIDRKGVGTAKIMLSKGNARTSEIANSLTYGAFDEIGLVMAVEAVLKGDSSEWKADIDSFEGKVMGLEILKEGPCSISGGFEGGEHGSLNMDISLKSSISGSGTEEIPSNLVIKGILPIKSGQSADLLLQGRVDLLRAKDTLARIFRENPEEFLAGFQPMGTGDINIRLLGPYDELGLEGNLTIKRGIMEPSGGFPYAIEDLDIDLAFDKRRIDVKNIGGKVLRGTLKASGYAEWGRAGIESYSLKTNLDGFHYDFFPQGFRMGGSLNARLQNAQGGGGEIKGDLTASYMEYTAEISLANMIWDNSIKSIYSVQAIDYNDPLDSISLDLDVDLLQPWAINTNLMKVKGKNKPSEKIKIRNTLASPGLQGGMELVPGGRITNIVPAGDIIIESGAIDFIDPTAFNPELNIQGQIDVTPFRVNLNLQGPVDNPNWAMTSTPSLRRDEIISLMLNPAAAQTVGNSAYSGHAFVSSLSSTGLAGATSGLLSTMALTSVVEQVRRTLKFDRVSVAYRTGFGGNAETDIIIGKNIEIMDWPLSLAGSYKSSSDIVMLGGQMEMRFGNLVIHLGANGSRALGVSPSGEIRYSWTSW